MDKVGNVVFDRTPFFARRIFTVQASFGFVNGFFDGIAFIDFAKGFFCFVYINNLVL